MESCRVSYQCFNVSIDGRIAHVQMSRPEKRNAMNLRYWDELPTIIREIDAEAEARVVVISSTGPHFSAGLDFQEFMAATADDPRDERTKRILQGADFYQKVTLMQQSFSVLESCRVPVLAAVQGGCIGAGVDLVSACDLRYATADAFFSIEEINIGMTADVGTFPRLVKLMPEGLVKELAYTGARLPADDARAAGLVNRVFADQQSMLDDVMQIAAQIASKAPLAIHGCKRIINYSRDHGTADTLDNIAVWNASMFQPEEVMEAVAARAEKRDGNFVDLPPLKKTLE